MSPDQPGSRDTELLSAYIDDALTDTERADLKARLQQEPALQRELDELRVVVQALRDLPPVKAPRSFTLTPQMVAPPPAPKAATFLAFPTSAMFSALSAAAATVLILFGVLVLFLQSGAPQMAATQPEAAMQAPPTLIAQSVSSTASSTPTPAPTQTALPQADGGIVLTAYVLPQAEPDLADADEADSSEAEAADVAAVEALAEAAEGAPQTDEAALDQEFAAGAAPAADNAIAGDAPPPTASALPTDAPTDTPFGSAADGAVTGGAGTAPTTLEAEQQRSLATLPPTAAPTRPPLNPTGTIVSLVLTPPALQTRAVAPPAASQPPPIDPAIITGGGAVGLGLLLLALAIATTVIRIRKRKLHRE